MLRRLTCISVLGAALVGCVATAPPNVREPVRDEELLHKELTLFYCEQRRWPTSWEEFSGWAENSSDPLISKGEDSPRGSFRDAKLSSPRAILLNVTYVDASNAERLVSYITPPSCQPTQDPKTVSIAGDRVLFSLPKNFTILDARGIQERWRNGAYPDAAWEDAPQDIVLAVRFGDAAVAPNELGGFARLIEAALGKSVTKIAWIAKRSKSGGEQPRLVHEFESDSSRGRLVTVGMSFSFDGKLLSINVAGPAKKRAEVEAVAEEVRTTLRLS